MADQVRQLQQQVDSLVNSVDSLRQETARLAPLQDRVLPPPGATPLSSTSSEHRQRVPLPPRVQPCFNGPTSLNFAVGVAKDTLHQMGYPGAKDGLDDGCAQQDTTPHASPSLAPVPSGSLAQSPTDPIWEFDEVEIMRLLKVYREEVDVMYPVASMGPIMEHVKYLVAWMDTARRGCAVPPPDLESVILHPKTLLLKILMCCALAVAEHGNSPRASRLYDSIQPLVDKMLMSSPADVTQLSFLALCAGYRFLSNDEVLAWRLIGQVARLCFELGLHRRECLQKIADSQIRRDALHTFWSAYVLDRRWSFGTGLPFVCHDDKIDPKLPYPEGSPFLVAMIGYSRLSAKIWRLVDHFEPAVVRELRPHDFEELDREIMEWYETVPEQIKSGPLDVDKMPVPSGPYDLQRQRIWTRLRLNQVRIWLYTPALHSAMSIAENAQPARKVVDLAKQTIRFLAHLNNETDQYRRMQAFYHQFLTSSIAVLFLASTHAPLQFSALCRDEFYMALDLIKDMSARSWVSRRLWRTIRSLREYAPRLGLEDSSERGSTGKPYLYAGSVNSGRSPGLAGPFNAAVGRAGGSAPMEASPSAPTPGSQSQPMHMADEESNGVRLQTEMSRIYEGYMGMNGAVGDISSPVHVGFGGAGLTLAEPSMRGAQFPGRGDGGVYQQVKDMF
ncbi:uncharacterized protein B0T15DRAFT_264936 [Chaetomium strumarium]|uniref:Xylanolytic transcriptional activator regulatory domain-containing protein n=1 Tax=Chaetomium strumarium TaxID=1170767 RepID=A0AAJ0GNF2_9PEZI|nr:hypothetical protein B0T15DRAFT_264936 [Chaetomium strumarium]